jgi:acetyl-CoA acetyltransferase
MADMDVMGAGNLMEAASGVGQRIQKQVGQNGVPVYNVANACATGATAIRCVYMAIKSGEADTGIAVGLEKMGKAGLLGGAPRSDKNVFEPSGRYGSVMSVEGASAPRSCPACSRRRAWSTPASTTAWVSSSSPRSPRRTTPTRR